VGACERERDLILGNAMKRGATGASVQRISVIVPNNPFVEPALQSKHHCLCALDVTKLMEWWPGTPHSPHRNPEKVKAIQRSLDWKRVAQIASYLLQDEIAHVPERLDNCFRSIYAPKQTEPGREWPPRVSKVITPMKSEFPTFSNVLLHVNGAEIKPTRGNEEDGAATLTFDEQSPDLRLSVIDGQHRINGAYFAVRLLQEKHPHAKWEIAAEVFLDLDAADEPPRKQAQIFIDVNFNQKKVDRSLVVDLFPTARGKREALDDKERAQDVGRKLMLDTGPLVGMIQIPGIKYGVKDVITLATLANAIEDVLPNLTSCGIDGLETQTEFLAQCLTAWLDASGRFEAPTKRRTLHPENVAYQGRVLVSILDLVPAMLWKLKRAKLPFVSGDAQARLQKWLHETAERAGLLDDGVFIDKGEFKNRKYLGSGGIGLFRNTLWAAFGTSEDVSSLKPERVSELAAQTRAKAARFLVSGQADE
jgi:DGQHR domain-containing protein